MIPDTHPPIGKHAREWGAGEARRLDQVEVLRPTRFGSTSGDPNHEAVASFPARFPGLKKEDPADA